MASPDVAYPSVVIVPAHVVASSSVNRPRAPTKGLIQAVLDATPVSKATGWEKLGWEENDLQAAANWYIADESRWKALLGRDGPDGASHRIMEWFVVNYAKAYDVKYMWNGREFSVSESYRNHMASLLKLRFDMFKRTGIGKGKTGIAILKVVDSATGMPLEIETNLRQMNFYRWAILHGVFDYLKAHKAEINADMSATLKKERPEVRLANGEIKKKRRRLKEPVHVVKHVKKKQKIKVC